MNSSARRARRINPLDVPVMQPAEIRAALMAEYDALRLMPADSVVPDPDINAHPNQITVAKRMGQIEKAISRKA